MDKDDLQAEVRRAARGDEVAAEQLFDHYHPRVYRYAFARLGDEQDAQDVAAETFARVLTELSKFRWRGAGFEAWLFRIARNLVIDQMRRSGREVLTDGSEVDRPATATGPEGRVLERELGAELGHMIDRLVPEQREVLLLRFGAELDGETIAKVMKKKPNAIRQLQFRALENLRSWMDSEMTVT